MKTARVIYIIILSCCSFQLFTQERIGADILYEQGKYQEAISTCIRELEETPKNINAYCYLVWSYFALRKYNESYEYAKKGMEVARYDRRMIFGAAEALYHLGRNNEAMKYLEEYAVYVNRTLNKDMIYNYMGEIFIRLGEFNNADIAFSTAVYYDSKNPAWWARLGYAREMAKDYQWSLDAYENALKLNPNLTEAQQGRERVSKLINE